MRGGFDVDCSREGICKGMTWYIRLKTMWSRARVDTSMWSVGPTWMLAVWCGTRPHCLPRCSCLLLWTQRRAVAAESTMTGGAWNTMIFCLSQNNLAYLWSRKHVRKRAVSQLWWLTTRAPAFGSLRQEDCLKFQARLGHKVRPLPQNKERKEEIQYLVWPRHFWAEWVVHLGGLRP